MIEELKFWGKLTKKNSGGGEGAGGQEESGRKVGLVGRVRVDVNEELKFCENSGKKNIFFFGGGGGRG